MTLPIEQLTPARASLRDEISERLYQDARPTGRFDSPGSNNLVFEPPLQGFPKSDLLLARYEVPVAPGEKA
jgi:hypothetical protein